MSNTFSLERLATALVVRFNRPESRNPLSINVVKSLTALVDQLDPGITKVIFTGLDDVFASGADLREIAALPADDVRAFALRGQSLMQKIAALPQMTSAAVNGYCFGGALDLALACDRRVASPNAKFAHPGTGLGIITGWGGTQSLPRLIGTAAALEMFFTAQPISAQHALRIGLIDEVALDPLRATLEFGR